MGGWGSGRRDWTPCNYGGARCWFLCPAAGCGRRVAILYGREILACRHCYKLAYRSQRQSASERSMRRAQVIRMKLGGSSGMVGAIALALGVPRKRISRKNH